MITIRAIKEESVFEADDISPGDAIVAINGNPIADLLDFRFHGAEEELDIEVRHSDGRTSVFEILKSYDDDLGLEFEPDRIKVCKADCAFCFVRQQPKKVMRRSLYIKDDDYRLSFLHGNYVTLTNLSEGDWERIIAMHLSPMYVSVHATDDTVRRRLLRQDGAPPIMDCLQRLIDHDIEVHTQAVITPGTNDGSVLERTIDDLAGLYPSVRTLSVVPVGLTRYRDRLIHVEPVSAEFAGRLIDQVDRHRAEWVARIGVPFADCADELYVKSGRDIPPASYYGEYQGLENGVGLLRQLIDGFAADVGTLPMKLRTPRALSFLTGTSAHATLVDLCGQVSDRVKGLSLAVLPIHNEFWGETVTVSGLLTGQDMVRQYATSGRPADALLLPPDCANVDGLTLDDMSIETMQEQIGIPVHRGSYDLIPSILGALDGDERTGQ